MLELEGAGIAVVVAAYAMVFIALAVGGIEATEDDFVGLLGAIALIGGLSRFSGGLMSAASLPGSGTSGGR
jgi:hypothetical protein